MAPGLADPSRWRDLRRRSLTAFVLAPVVLVCLWWGGIAWEVLVGVVAVGLGYEWVQLCNRAEGQGSALDPQKGGARRPFETLHLSSAGPGLLPRRVQGGARPFLLPLGILYVAPAVIALLWLRAKPAGVIDMLLVLLIVWATDIGAYLAGRWFGGPKLAPSISPGKTWSGAVGGVVGAGLVSAGMIAWLGHAIGGTMVILLFLLFCLLLSVVAQAGDLMESALKRKFGVKDSGWLIPGHGGLFDRLDGVLAAAPAGAALALALGRGVVGSG